MEKTIKDLEELLSEKELEFFQSLAPSYKKIFVRHAFGAKTEKTMLKNIDEVKDAMDLKCKNMHEYKRLKNPLPTANKDLTDQEKIDLYFEKVEDKEYRKKVIDLYKFILSCNPSLTPIYAWNQPMVKYNETFICAVSVAKNHFSIALEAETMLEYKEQFNLNNYEMLKKGIKIKYTQEINLDLIKEIINFTIVIKKDAKGFWS